MLNCLSSWWEVEKKRRDFWGKSTTNRSFLACSMFAFVLSFLEVHLKKKKLVPADIIGNLKYRTVVYLCILKEFCPFNRSPRERHARFTFLSVDLLECYKNADWLKSLLASNGRVCCDNVLPFPRRPAQNKSAFLPCWLQWVLQPPPPPMNSNKYEEVLVLLHRAWRVRQKAWMINWMAQNVAGTLSGRHGRVCVQDGR